MEMSPWAGEQNKTLFLKRAQWKHDKTQSWPLLPSKSHFITRTPQNNQENHNFDPFSKFNCAKY